MQSGEQRPVSIEPIRLIALDLDGTLLRSDLSICAPSAEALGEAVERGVKVVLTTGRSPRETVRFYEAMGLSTPVICHNGALVVANPAKPEPMYHRPLRGDVALAALKIAQWFGPTLALGVEVVDKVYTRKDGLLDREDLFKAPVTKVVMAGDTQPLTKVQSELAQRLSGKIAFAPSNMRLMQVTHPDATKSKTLAVVAKAMGITSAQVMAIGDAPNDLCMIRWAGVGVALGNAFDAVKAAAHITMPSNDQAGVAAAVRRFVLR